MYHLLRLDSNDDFCRSSLQQEADLSSNSKVNIVIVFFPVFVNTFLERLTDVEH